MKPTTIPIELISLQAHSHTHTFSDKPILALLTIAVESMKRKKRLRTEKITKVVDEDFSDPATPNTFKFFSVNFTPTSAQNYKQRFPEYTSPSSPDSLDIEEESSEDSTMSLEKDRNDNSNSQSLLGKCCSKIDFWALLAALLSITGGILFSVFEHMTLNITLVVLQEVMHVHFERLQTLQAIMTAFGAITSALTFLVFLASFISKAEIDDTKKPPSRIPSTIFMVALYPFIFLWLFLMGTSIAFGLLSFVLQGVCQTEEISGLWQGERPPISSTCKTTNEGQDCLNCINLYPFHFLFPPTARKEDMWICGTEIVDLCSSNMPYILHYWIIAFSGTLLVVVGLAVHEMALSYNRTDLGTLMRNQDYAKWLFTKRRVKRALTHNDKGRKAAKRTSSFF